MTELVWMKKGKNKTVSVIKVHAYTLLFCTTVMFLTDCLLQMAILDEFMLMLSIESFTKH